MRRMLYPSCDPPIPQGLSMKDVVDGVCPLCREQIRKPMEWFDRAWRDALRHSLLDASAEGEVTISQLEENERESAKRYGGE